MKAMRSLGPEIKLVQLSRLIKHGGFLLMISTDLLTILFKDPIICLCMIKENDRTCI